jgi:hypothetical protein
VRLQLHVEKLVQSRRIENLLESRYNQFYGELELSEVAGAGKEWETQTRRKANQEKEVLAIRVRTESHGPII